MVFGWDQTVAIDYKKYQNAYKAYRKDPLANFKKKTLEGEIYMTDDAGNRLNGADYIKSQEKLMNERIKKNNNVLEIDLLK